MTKNMRTMLLLAGAGAVAYWLYKKSQVAGATALTAGASGSDANLSIFANAAADEISGTANTGAVVNGVSVQGF